MIVLAKPMKKIIIINNDNDYILKRNISQEYKAKVKKFKRKMNIVSKNFEYSNK